MSITEYVNALKNYRKLAPDIVCHRSIPPETACFEKKTVSHDSPLRKIFARLGMPRFYAHQAEAIDKIRRGVHTVVATPTASGKSLVYNFPVVEQIIENPLTRALYLFPLKALARDQLGTIEKLLGASFSEINTDSPGTAMVYDGDLSGHARTKIRKNPPNILLTNPEMLHLSMLAHHHLWESFFTDLKFVVVDEVHTYRGVMGSHMAWVFRRLRRICNHYGASPVFVFCSATIDNPRELSASLTGLDVSVVDQSGSPAGKKEILLMGGMDGAARTAILLMHAAIHRGLRTIVYTQSRKITELIAMWASQRAGALGSKISAYRAGFLPEERREIEKKLATGELLAVVSTSALELGIDIGNLDLCILVGYPGTIMSTWQRAGRVGRGGRHSAMILIAHEDALDHYFVKNPNELFDMPPEKAVINPYNSVIMARHLECAAADLPLKKDEGMLAHEKVGEALKSLERQVKLLKNSTEDVWFASRKSPHRHVSLRGMGRTIPIFLGKGGKNLGDVDSFRAFYETHEGAVYIHHGETFVVTRFDHEKGVVEVEKDEVNYFTRARSSKSTEILEILDSKSVWNTRIGFGRLKVTDHVTGYERKLVSTRKSLGVVPLNLPPLTFETEGVWIEIPERVREFMESKRFHFMGGIHAVEHAVIGILPLLVMTDRNDLGGISIPFHPAVEKAAVFVYDGTPGGIGLSRQAFVSCDVMLERTFQAIKSCDCENGCPACVHSPKCGSGNRPIDKSAALHILSRMKADDLHPSLTDRDAAIYSGETRFSSGNGAFPLPDRDVHEKQLEYDAGTFRYGVLDIETRRSAKEVGGWHKADKMGVSCAVLYDSGENRFKPYLQDDISVLEADLKRLDLIIGFNIVKFDYKVLSGLSNFNFHELPTLDLLLKVHEKLGYRLSLDRLARETLGAAKSADGLLALKWWKEGRLEEIIEYCTQDVRVTRDLYRYGREHKYVLFRNKAGSQVRLPVEW